VTGVNGSALIGGRRVDHTVRIVRQLLVVIGRVREDGRERGHSHVEIARAHVRRGRRRLRQRRTSGAVRGRRFVRHLLLLVMLLLLLMLLLVLLLLLLILLLLEVVVVGEDQ